MTSGNHLSYGEQKLRNEQWQQGLLWCNECKQFKPAKLFYKNNGKNQNTNYGYRCYCIECENGKKRNKSRASVRMADRNRSLKIEVVGLMGGHCHRCGYNEFDASLELHHVYPAKKKVNPMVAVYNRGIAGAWQELDKCCLLCRNCHMAYEAGKWRAEFIKRDGLGWTVGAALPLDDDRYTTGKPPVYHQATLPEGYRAAGPVQMTLLEPITVVYSV